MILLHSDCGGLLVIKLNESFDFYSYLTLSGKQININNLFIKTVNKIPTLHCIKCEEDFEFDLEKIITECRSCKEIHALKDIRFHEMDNEICYCESCIEEKKLDGYFRKVPNKITFGDK